MDPVILGELRNTTLYFCQGKTLFRSPKELTALLELTLILTLTPENPNPK